MDSSHQDNNKRIAKNTLLLYFRMILLMLISLYTSRVVLNALGVEDFGIYNVVGGVVAMFAIISGSLSASISRFITFELGKGDFEKLKRVFSTSVTIQIVLAVIIVVLAEIIGLWFLNCKMVIPADRMEAANWVFQFSLLTFAINLISIPYNASIIAHEKMSAFAYISILEAVGKLLVAFTIASAPIDKLVFYALMLASIAILIRILYGLYCKKHFEECTYHFIYDHTLLKKMFGFAGWNFIGATSAILRDQGGNIVINLFCGPAVNAARGISYQVNTAINGFVANFMTALNPQITKSYAGGDYEYMFNLIFKGARFSFYILLLLSLPVFINTHYILQLWLGIVPDHTVFFVQLVLIFAMSESISSPLITAMLATGNIRNYQLIVGGLQMLNLPIFYVLLRIGFVPETVFVVAIIISQCCFVARLLLLRGMIKLPVGLFLKKVYCNVLLVSVLSFILPYIVSQQVNESFWSFVLISLFSILNTLAIIYFVGCSKEERKILCNKLIQVKQKMIKR